MGIPIEWIATLKPEVAASRATRRFKRTEKREGVTVQVQVPNPEYGKRVRAFRVFAERWYDAREKSCIAMGCNIDELVVVPLMQWKQDHKAKRVKVWPWS